MKIKKREKTKKKLKKEKNMKFQVKKVVQIGKIIFSNDEENNKLFSSKGNRAK